MSCFPFCFTGVYSNSILSVAVMLLAAGAVVGAEVGPPLVRGTSCGRGAAADARGGGGPPFSAAPIVAGARPRLIKIAREIVAACLMPIFLPWFPGFGNGGTIAGQGGCWTRFGAAGTPFKITVPYRS